MPLKWLLLLLAGVVALNTFIFLGGGQPAVNHNRVNGWSSGPYVDRARDRRSLAAVQQQSAYMGDAAAAVAETELLCADRPDFEGGCHAWRCHEEAAKTVWCKATCGTCELLRREVERATGVAARPVAQLSGCTDVRRDCGLGLAVPGLCGDDPELMRDCQASCGFCKQAALTGGLPTLAFNTGEVDRILPGGSDDDPPPWRPPPCSDDLTLCPHFRRKGLCSGGAAGGWVASQCRVTCGLCDPEKENKGAVLQVNTAAAMLPLQQLQEPLETSACHDYHPECAEWQKKMFCSTNPSFMSLNCKAACNLCKPGNKPQPARPARFDKQPPRASLVTSGPAPAPAAAVINGLPVAMGVPLTGVRPGQRITPVVIATPVAVVKPEPVSNEEWAPFTLCGTATSWTDSGVDCAKMVAVPLKPCKDSRKECTVWYHAGECKRNADYMMTTCKASCQACNTYVVGDSGTYEYLTLGPPAQPSWERIRRAIHQAADNEDDIEEAKKTAKEDEKEKNFDPQEKLHIIMPVVGFGTAGLGDDTAKLVTAAIKKGYTLIDTADAREWYRQDLVGEGVKASKAVRATLFLVSKVHPRDFGRGKLREALGRILQELQTAYVDLLLLHYPRCYDAIGCPAAANANAANALWQETWKEMEKIRAEGKARAIGVSNFNANEMHDLLSIARVKPAVLQARSDPLASNTHLVNLCLENGIQFMSYSLLGTQWAETHKPGDTNPVLTHPVIKKIAADADKTPAQVVVRWALQRGMVAIPRTTSEQHMADNLDVHEFELDEDQMAAMNALDGTYKGKSAAPGA